VLLCDRETHELSAAQEHSSTAKGNYQFPQVPCSLQS
jgi:hypothetical protein